MSERSLGLSQDDARAAVLFAALAMIFATNFWGLSGGAVAGVHVNGFTAAAVIELTTGILLTVIGKVGGVSFWGTIKLIGRRRLAALAVIEATNAAFYYAALQMAPLGPVMALHLVAPLPLAFVAIWRGQRKLAGVSLLSLTLIASALLLIATKQPSGDASPHFWLGLSLSLLSAGCIACFITLVRQVAGKVHTETAAGIQMLGSGLLLSPALYRLWDRPGTIPPLLIIAITMFMPACWLYWRAMAGLTPMTATSIQLLEPFFGMLSAILLYNLLPSLIQVAAVVLVAGAIFLEVRQQEST